MPRFSVAFSKRKNTADGSENVDVTPPGQSSFRVLERSEFANGKSFDGGARMARASGPLLPKPDFHVEDNMFADMKTNRGSGLSHTTHATSTDNSSRHSNASTAPSSADFSGGNVIQDENRVGSKPSSPASPASPETPGRGQAKGASIGSKFLDRAGRTFSFGGQKKHTIPPPREDPVPDLPPVLTLKKEPGQEQPRGMTASTSSTATPPKTAPGDPIDLGGDFSSMFPSFDKRASMATLKNDMNMAAPRLLTGNQPAPLSRSPDMTSAADPLLKQWGTPNSNADKFDSNANSPIFERPPPVPPHQSPSPAKYRPSTSPAQIREDEDTQLLQETQAAIKLLASAEEYSTNTQSGRYRREEESFTVLARKQNTSAFNNIQEDDNLFAGSTSRFARSTHRYISPQANNPPRNKVMTPAQFEKYRQDKISLGSTDKAHASAAKDDEEEDINYDDDEDEAEKSKQQAKQRRKQEAHMAVYRQQMMKVTGETAAPNRPGLPSSISAPQLSHMKSPSPNLPGGSEEDEDEEVPLAILQAHGFPGKNRPPTRLSTVGSNPNLRASGQFGPGRPPSVMGESATASRRHSTLPAFARNLPQDPFIGAGLARPALREPLPFGDATQGPKPPSPLPPGGLVGVIASEERARAMRRGSPSVDAARLMGSGFNGPNGPGIDPIAGIPHHAMYSQGHQGQGSMAGGMPGMMPGMNPSMPHLMHQMPQQMPPPMQQQMLTPGDQAQLQMNHQMSQFMQMQMQFMQMMAVNQNGGMPQQAPYGGLPSNHSMVDLSSRHSMVGEPAMEPRRMDYSMRTMSMVQPSSAPMIQHPGYAGSIRSAAMGYAPSIAPSERSNIGLPSRYRPVSQVAVSPPSNLHGRTGSLSGAISAALGENKGKATMKVVNKSASTSDDDDEEGWEAMKTKREKKKSLWKSKRGLSSVF